MTDFNQVKQQDFEPLQKETIEIKIYQEFVGKLRLNIIFKGIALNRAKIFVRQTCKFQLSH